MNQGHCTVVLMSGASGSVIVAAPQVPICCWKYRGNNLIRRMIAFAAFAGAAMSVSAQQPAKLNTPGAWFGVRENVQQVDISPDGSRIVYLTPGAGRSTAAYVADLSGGGDPALVIRSSGNPDRLSWCRFVSNTRLICKLTGEASDIELLVPFSRLVAIDADGMNMAMLGQKSSADDARVRQFDGDILDWLPDEDGAVLMAREYVPEVGKTGSRLGRKADGMGIDRIDLATMRATRVEGASNTADYFISDGRGNVRIKAYRPDRGLSGQLSARTLYHYRLPGSTDWKPFSSWENGVGMVPIEVDAGANSAYVLKTLDGRLALYRVKLDGSMATELVYRNGKVDVDGVVRLGRGARVIGVTFAEEKRKVIYFDPQYEALSTALGKTLPNLPLVDFIGSSSDNNKLLLRAGSDSDPGRYYVYDKAGRALNEILLARPALENVRLATVRPISYPSGDGTTIPGYLTLPAGKEDARGLPAVVLPHGGPSARDEWGFDWLAQFLAHHGFAVLQPNYRGSAGFGDAWLQENGFKGWRTSIGDVIAAGRWLAAQGIADPDQLAIVGWSYGGYAALQAGVVEPELFKALVAIAPVTDLALLKSEARGYTHERLVAEEVGVGPHETEGSPLQNVDKIKAPVLMFHGDMDLNVGVQQSRKMDAGLRSAGKTSELVIYEGLEHSLADSNARALMLDRIAVFLKAHIRVE